MGYHRAGFEVIGVDLKQQPDYPFEFWQDNALAVLSTWGVGWSPGNRPAYSLADFAAIHVSPPCQSWTAYRRRGDGVGDGYAQLIDPIRRHLIEIGLPYVIENVPGAPLNDPVQLCGSSFGLDVRRHRLFESSVPLSAPPCDHAWQTPRFPPATNRTNLRSTVEVGVWRIPLAIQQEAMGIDWLPLRELSEAIPPAYTEHIGAHLINAIRDSTARRAS